MCYNIIINGKNPPKSYRKNRITVRKTGNGGILWPLYFLLKRPGLIVGGVAFVLFCFFLNGRVLGYSLEDVPLKDRSGVVRTLTESGAVRMAKFSSLDEDALAERIVKENSGIGFASVYKEGSFLVVKTLPFCAESEVLGKDDITSPVAGVVERIAVLRGTPLVEVGDRISEGQPLVGAYFIADGNSVPTVPAAEIIIRAEYVFALKVAQSNDAMITAVVAIAKEKCPETNIIEHNYTVCEADDGCVITVTLTYERKIGG